jgi:peptidoglycan/xylan/chitin deacetylase (PgdA/CDA1 family)
MLALILALLTAATLAHTAPFPFLLDAAAPAHVMWRAPRSLTEPTIYLTFDDGPNPTATPALLDVLQREGVAATFFVIDRHVTPETAPILRRIAAEGHALALHTHTRRLMWRSPAAMAQWIGETAARLEHTAGARPCPAFRPHGGWRSVTMLAGVARAGYRLVGWGWNAWDWNWFRRRTADAVVGRILARAHDGLIVVIHDGHHENPRAERGYAVEATARLIPALRARGFAFATICDAIALDARSPAVPGGT